MSKKWETTSFEFKDKDDTVFKVTIESGELPKVSIIQKEKIITFESTVKEIKNFAKWFHEAPIGDV